MGFTKLGKVNFENQNLLLGGAALSFACALFFHAEFKRPEINATKQETALNINNLALRLFSVGNKRLAADALWIQTLIESDLEAYRGDPYNNWMYLRFRSISELDPFFYENYLFGGQYLSIVKDDVQGAEEIMDKGLRLFPDDYRLNFNQGFNSYFEMGDLEKGLRHLERVKEHPDAPRFLPSLLIKLRHQLNRDPVITISLLKEAYDKNQDPFLRKKLEKDIYSIKATIDLDCLNSGRSDCETKDALGNPYFKEGGVYKSRLPFAPYELHGKK